MGIGCLRSDGSSLNLPRGLVHEGWRTPVDGAHYPQGLVSCLYRLQARLPVDFDLHAHGNERATALAHLNVLSANDVVVYDRGATIPMRCCTRMRSGDCTWCSG